MMDVQIAGSRGASAASARVGSALGWFALALALGIAAPAARAGDVPSAEGALDGQEPRVRARLVFHPDDAAGRRSADAAGADRGPQEERRVRLGVLLEMDPGWHVYWHNPGRTGLPTEIRWTVEGGEVGATAWPAPERFGDEDPELVSFGYAGRVLLTAEAALREGAGAGRTARAEVSVLACADQCIPGRFELSRTLGRGAVDGPEIGALFASTAERVPRAAAAAGLELEARYSQDAIRPGDSFQAALVVRAPRGAAPQPLGFFPARTASVDLDLAREVPAMQRHDIALLALHGRAHDADPGRDERLSGVLTLRGAQGDLTPIEVDLPLPRARAGVAVAQLGTPWIVGGSSRAAGALPTVELARALGLALLGGLILNLMPCVLPVLAIKVFSLVELSRRSRAEVAAHVLAYTGGILLSMTALAGVVIALRAAGAAVGWGFQFQEPAFVLVISAVLVVFALNLFGVFEIGVDSARLAELGQQAHGASRSFFEGLLAVVLATPCSAPFVGTAAGLALSSPAPVLLAIFATIGLGLALPYALVALSPSWARFLPRSGAWMLRLRAGLGFALLGTVAWLLWVLGRSVGNDGTTAALVALLVLAFATWLYGQLQETARAPLRLAAGLGIVVVALSGVLTVRVQTSGAAPGTEIVEELPFDPERIRAELQRGRPALVYFTADWCITCAVNEKLVLSNARLQRELRERDVAVFKADWTRRDERIRAELARFGKGGVPMYLVYTPDAPQQPALLPELLTVDVVLQALAGVDHRG
jgi:thiol:disulfide interchange protein DsbD